MGIVCPRFDHSGNNLRPTDSAAPLVQRSPYISKIRSVEYPAPETDLKAEGQILIATGPRSAIDFARCTDLHLHKGEKRDVLRSRGIHISKFPDGHDCGIRTQQARDQLRHVVGFGVADEITKLDQLKKSGSITDAEFGRLRTKLVS